MAERLRLPEGAVKFTPKFRRGVQRPRARGWTAWRHDKISAGLSILIEPMTQAAYLDCTPNTIALFTYCWREEEAQCEPRPGVAAGRKEHVESKDRAPGFPCTWVPSPGGSPHRSPPTARVTNFCTSLKH